MTQSQLDRAVARSTGESLRTIRRLGFGLNNRDRTPPNPGPEGLDPAVACPSCGRPCDLPRARSGCSAMAECIPCDLYFDRPGRVADAAIATGEDAA